MKNIRTASVLLNNQAENPFFEILDEFLDRQLFLNSSITVALNWRYESDIEFSHVYYGTDNKLMFHRYINRITPQSTSELERHKNMFFLTLVAQSVESIETFLKRVTAQILNAKLGPSSKLLRNKFRTNKERFDFITSYCPLIHKYITEEPRYKDHYDAYFLIEQIRHAIVHSKQMINDRNNSIVDSSLFKKWFTVDTNPEGIIIRIGGGEAGQIFVMFSDLAYMIFESLSKQEGYNMVKIGALPSNR